MAIIWLLMLATAQAVPAPYCENFRPANYYGDNMVLQQGPLKSVIWGYVGEEGVDVYVNFDGTIYQDTSAMGPEGEPIWRVELDPMSGGTTAYTITITTIECGSIQLQNVVFGDVQICSGQSNMVWRLDQIDDPQPDIDDAPNYPYVRTMQLGTSTSSSPLYEPSIARGWAEPTSENTASFSAVCWFFGKGLFLDKGIPVGLIQTAYGGTRIEAWSSQDTLEMCFGTEGPPEEEDHNAATVLYNAMIHPLLRMPIFGGIWYQGESNNGRHDHYMCNLPTMIDDWRNKWFESTNENTDIMLPFGIVQLAGYRPANNPDGWPDIRWAQSGRQGYVPNDILHHCYFAVAHDLPDFDGDQIHPRFKRPIAERLVLGLHFLEEHEHPRGYDETYERHMGPLPERFNRVGDRVVLEYLADSVLEYRDTTNSIHFDMCCSDSPSIDCNEDATWVNVPDIAVQSLTSLELDVPCAEGQVVMGIRYAWRESPCQLEQCAIYDNFNDHGFILDLPAPPFTYTGLIN